MLFRHLGLKCAWTVVVCIILLGKTRNFITMQKHTTTCAQPKCNNYYQWLHLSQRKRVYRPIDDSWIYYKNRTWCPINGFFLKKKTSKNYKKLRKIHWIKLLLYLRDSVMISVYAVWNTTSYIWWPFSDTRGKAFSKVLERSCNHPMWNVKMTDCWFEKKNVSTTNTRCVLDQHKTTNENASVYQHKINKSVSLFSCIDVNSWSKSINLLWSTQYFTYIYFCVEEITWK